MPRLAAVIGTPTSGQTGWRAGGHGEGSREKQEQETQRTAGRTSTGYIWSEPAARRRLLLVVDLCLFEAAYPICILLLFCGHRRCEQRISHSHAHPRPVRRAGLRCRQHHGLSAAAARKQATAAPCRPLTVCLQATCNADCQCLGDRSAPQLYCGYCADIEPAAGFTGVIYGSDMNRCMPDGSCCDLGFADVCNGPTDPAWCGHAVEAPWT